jgi:hypothetical protein
VSDDPARDGFLARWSRRKRGEGQAAAPEPPKPPSLPAPPAEAGPAGTAEHEPACPIPDLPATDLASLPGIEELTADSDFSLFLRPGIPAGLRHAALRRMWSLDPSIRDYIGPVEYQWDFNAPGGLPLGFAGELAGDVERLLSQAIGRIAGGPAAPRAEAAAAEAGPRTPAAAAADSAPAPALAAEEDGRPETPSSASDAATETRAERSPARRRHGRALPV